MDTGLDTPKIQFFEGDEQLTSDPAAPCSPVWSSGPASVEIYSLGLVRLDLERKKYLGVVPGEDGQYGPGGSFLKIRNGYAQVVKNCIYA